MIKFEKHTANALAAEIEAALQQIAQKHGVTIRRAGGKFDDGTFDMKLQIKIADPQAALDLNKQVFERNCRVFGLVPEDFGRTFMISGKRYRVDGIELKRRKYPIRVFDYSKGQQVLMTEMIVPAVREARNNG